jgi:hypothetical protein
MQGSSCGKACAACVKTKQCCRGFLGKEKQAVTEPTVLGEVMPVLRDIVEVLRGIWAGMRGLEEAIDGCWAPVGSKEDESEGEEAEDAELIEELVGLSEEAADYCAFWRAKYRGEYRAMVPGKDGRNVEEEMEKRRRRRRKGMKGMKWKWMEWSQARRGPQTEKYSTYYFCSVFVFILL